MLSSHEVIARRALAHRTVREALTNGSAELAEAGCETPRLDVELLLASVLGVSRARLALDATVALDSSALDRFQALLSRRAAREPVAYLLGRKDFRRITLTVDRRVLIPRPETELLVDVGLSLPTGARVVDVATGSGAVALALKDERPDLSIRGTELSGDALKIARANAQRLGLAVRFLEADLLGGLSCDAVLANLPYVAEHSPQLPPEIALYEPRCALFGGEDGLDIVRRLVPTLEGVGVVGLEVGAGQADAVAALLEGAGFRSVARVRDLAGHERVLVGRR